MKTLATRILCIIALTASAWMPARAAGPVDVTTLPLAQRLTLAPGTTITYLGKATTAGALIAAHQALLAHFQAASSLKSLVTMPPHKPITITRQAGAASPVLYAPIVGPLSGTVTPASPAPNPTPTKTPATQHVPNQGAASAPIDYQAACGQISVCVYVPPALPEITYEVSQLLILSDPYLTSDVCTQDGGVWHNGLCNFSYPLTGAATVFPGKPPALESSVSCPNTAFTTLVDPMGAARIGLNGTVTQGSASIVCAIDLYTPTQ
jgi:hypothetical protein